MKEDIEREIVLAEKVTAKLEGSLLTITGPKGIVVRNFAHPKVKIIIKDNHVMLSVNKGTKREKTIISSFTAHITNMVKGVLEPFQYRLKICSGHFPMNVSVTGKELVIKNFLGESVPRRVGITPGAEVKIDGTEILVTSPDKEIAGQVASRIENLCRITNRDIRIFQDGCYIVNKGGKDL